MKQTVLLTGASGSVGREALAELLRRKPAFSIRVFDLDTPKNRRLFKTYENEIEVFYGDLRKPEDLVAPSQGVDQVIHLAALIPPVADHKPELAKGINTDGTLNLIKALEQHSPEAFFIYSSSVSLYGDRVHTPWIKVSDPYQPSEGDFYAVTKKMAEDHLRASQLNWTIFRLSGIFSSEIAPDPLMFHMPLDTSLEFTTARDTGYAMVQALSKQAELVSRTFNLGGGENCRLIFRDFLDKSFEQFGLGRDFLPERAFADQNFHCGYYADSHVLNDILHFQRDTTEIYLDWLRKSKGPVIRSLARLTRPIVRWSLIRQSEPLRAIRQQDRKLINRFYRSARPVASISVT